MTNKQESRYTLELCRQVWDDKHGERIEVSEDADGLDLVELVQVSAEGVRSNHFTIPPEQALLVAEAMRQCAGELLAKEREDKALERKWEAGVEGTVQIVGESK